MKPTRIKGWLLDTLALLWMLHGDKRLSKTAAQTIDDCRILQELPKHHGDPFDRMLICQAKRLGLGIISIDPIIDSYGVQRLW